MKRNRLLKTIALAICLGTFGAATASAQLVASLESYHGSLVVDRFGTQNGQLVAYGRLIPSASDSRVFIDESIWGGWTGIGTGYGESGVESRSNMLSSYSSTYDNDRVGIDVRMGPTSGNDRVASGIDLSVGPTSGNDRIASDIDLSVGPTSANDRTKIDADFGATSANDRTKIDAKFGPTSENDRTKIDLKFGPTSENDRVASGLDVKMGPTSGNDRTSIDAKFGPTSENDRTSLDARFGPTSENDRTAIDLKVGPTSGNDQVASGIDVQMGPTSGNDRVATGIDLQVGPTSGNDRVAGVVSSDVVVIPVTVLAASCEEVSLSFAGSDPVIVTSISSDDETRNALCAVDDVTHEGDNAAIANQLNQLIGS